MFDSVIQKVYKRSVNENPVEMYASLLTVYAYARYGIYKGDQKVIEDIRQQMTPFIQGEVPLDSIVGSYKSYEAGGNGTAYLWFKGEFDSAGPALERSSRELLKNHPRSAESLFSMPGKADSEHVWIDTVYAVTPYLTWLGLGKGDESLVNEAHDQMKKSYDLLLNPDNGMLHQARGFNGFGIFSSDHWSRGNGWGLLALADVIDILPPDHKHHSSYAQMLKDLLSAVLKYQDEWGMWHQEMTLPESYVEVSGTGLILYALGRALEKKVLEGESYYKILKKGIAGLMRYISLDGSIHNCCRGCLAPEEGRIEDYIRRGWVLNDVHAFGPVILALTEADIAGLSWDELFGYPFPRGLKEEVLNVNLPL
jgi:unsaturated rhamnogalacturonyl hydrolase